MNTSIIIPVYNRQQNFETCLRSMTYQTEKNIEWIIVDDGTDEYDVKEVAWKYLDCQVFRLELWKDGTKPYRRAQAINLGMAGSIGDFIHVIDADMVIPPDFVENINRFHHRYKNLYIVPRCAYMPSTDATGNSDIVSTIDSIIPLDDPNVELLGNISIRREWFWKAKGYNNTYTGWGNEDEEFCVMCCMAGTIPIIADEIIYHLPHEREPEVMVRHTHRSYRF